MVSDVVGVVKLQFWNVPSATEATTSLRSTTVLLHCVLSTTSPVTVHPNDAASNEELYALIISRSWRIVSSLQLLLWASTTTSPLSRHSKDE